MVSGAPDPPSITFIIIIFSDCHRYALQLQYLWLQLLVPDIRELIRQSPIFGNVSIQNIY